MHQQQIVSYFFIGLFLFILYQLALIISPFFTAIFWAAILSFAFYPMYRKILALDHVNRSLASLVSTVLVLLIVVIPSAFVLVSLMQEAAELYQRVSRLIGEGRLELWGDKIRQALSAERVQKLLAHWNLIQEDAAAAVLKGAKAIGNFSAIQLAAFTKNVFVWIFNFFVMTILLFFFFRDGKQIYDLVYQLIPMSNRNKQTLAAKINEMFSAVIRGQLVTSIVQAGLTGLAFWVLALPLPFFFGFLAFLTSMIPVTGAATVWVPFVVYLFLAGETAKAAILLLIGTFGISLSDNLLKPLLIGEKTKLPIFLLFLGILGGLNLYGFTGLFVGPVVISLFFVLLEIYQKEYQTKA